MAVRPTTLSSSLRDEEGFTLVEIAVGLVLSALAAGLVLAFLAVAARQSAKWQQDVEAAAALHALRSRIARDVRAADTLVVYPGALDLIDASAARVRYHASSDTLFRTGRPALPPSVRTLSLRASFWDSEARLPMDTCTEPAGGEADDRMLRPALSADAEPVRPILVVVEAQLLVQGKPRALSVCVYPRRPLVATVGARLPTASVGV